MTLAAGTHLGSYEVLAPIGSGGMGEVYQAHDTKLGRDVAIKVLSETFAHDPERLSRFQREAKILASLNHPNIATIHGLEHSDNVHYLVMELVSGDTLRERIAKEGPLPVEEALGICRQIAEALEAAHDKGIIHRDLKPANVKVTPEGKVKVLDFGLAKAFANDSANDDPSNSPTLSRAATMQGVILGTAAYMSPEQARGKAVDKATDIWAFGAVLYELLCGRPAFEGEDVTEILAAVVKTEPDWSRLPESTPPSMRTLLRLCLRKDRRQRLQDATGVRIEIEEALAVPSMGPIATAPTTKGWWHPLLWSVTSSVAVAVIATIAVWNLKPTPPKPVTRTVVALPSGERLEATSRPTVAVSPDGSSIAYVAIRGDAKQLYIRPLDSLEAKPIPGTEGAFNPFFSPDGQWLGFFAGGKLKKISINGGAALTLTDASPPMGASWSSQGMILFAPTSGGPLQQVSAAGGGPQPLTHLEKGEANHRWPEFLPGGNAVLFTARAAANSRVAVYSIATGKRQDLIEGATYPKYSPTGHLIYVQGGTLMAAPFDSQKLQLTGAAFPVVENILEAQSSGVAHYSISTAGSLIYISGGLEATQNKLVWVSRNGTEQPLPAPTHAYRTPRFSPDGQKIAVELAEQGIQVWLYDLMRRTLTPFTFDGTDNRYPSWTPDGKRIAFASNKEGTLNIFWELADGSGGVERLYKSDFPQYPSSFSSDGQLLAFIEINPTTGFDIWVLRLSDRKPQPFLRTRFEDVTPRFSPGGRWLAYSSDESGRREIYVRPYPGPGGKWQISTEGGAEPVWNRNGRELFYRSGNKMMAVDITAHPSLEVGQPRMLFEGAYIPSLTSFPNYDVSVDGQRFLMLKPSEQEQAPTQINVVQNWFEELKQKVPTGKK